MPQAWIDGAVVRETTAGNISIEDLLAGKAFIPVHTAAMFSLITDPVIVTATNVPETLLFDVNRLSHIQREYNHIVDSVAILVTATHAVIGSEKHPSQGQREVMTELVDRLLGEGSDLEAITVDFCHRLDSARVLTDPDVRAKLLKAFSACVANKNDHVRQLM